MEQVIANFVANAPYAALFMLIAKQLYDDWKADRAAAQAERLITIAHLTAMDETLAEIASIFRENGFTVKKTPTINERLLSGDVNSLKP